jgi:hypothetical protein
MSREYGAVGDGGSSSVSGTLGGIKVADLARVLAGPFFSR